MGFQDLAFMSSSASFPPHFLDIVVEVSDVGLWTATCLKTVFGGKQWHPSCKILLLHKASLCISQII